MDKKLKPVVINNTNDIRKAIAPFIKEVKTGKVDIAGEVTWSDDDGNKHTTNVKSYSSDINMRQSLLDGFEQVKEQEKMWNNIHNVLQDDEYGAVLPKPDIDKVHMPVDRIIRHRLGGEREGMTIVWHLHDRKVVFDPYNKRLDEIMEDGDEN